MCDRCMYLSTHESPCWRRTHHTRRTELTCHELTHSDSVTHWLLGHIRTRSCKTGTCSLSIPKSSVAIQHSVLKTELPFGSLELSLGNAFISEKPPEKPPFFRFETRISPHRVSQVVGLGSWSKTLGTKSNIFGFVSSSSQSLISSLVGMT